MTKFIRESDKEGIHLILHVSRFLHIIVYMGCPVFILQIDMFYTKCSGGRLLSL